MHPIKFFLPFLVFSLGVRNHIPKKLAYKLLTFLKVRRQSISVQEDFDFAQILFESTIV